MREVTVVLGELAENSNQRAPVKNKSKSKTDRIRGLEVGELNARARRELELDANVTGVLVIGVDPGSAAAKARIRRGDVIVAVEKRAIDSVRALGRALKAQRGEALIRIRRGSSSVFVILGDTQ